MKLSLDIKGELIPHIGFLKAPAQPVNNKGGPRPSAFLGFALSPSQCIHLPHPVRS